MLNLCQPELSLDMESLNARLTRLEDQLKSGKFVVAASVPQKQPVPEDQDDERPPMPGDEDAPPAEEEDTPAPAKPAPEKTAAPAGFWTELMEASRKELKPPAKGFFVAAQNSPLRGALKGSVLELRCANAFVAEAINRPDILEVVSRKASALLGKPLSVSVVDMTAKPAANPQMEQLLNFGRAHSDIVKIKE